MTCIRIKFVLPIQSPLEFIKKKVITLKLPEQDIDFKVNVSDNIIYRSYTLKSKPIDIEIQDSTINKIRDCLYLSSFDIQSGILLNPELASGIVYADAKNRSNTKGIKIENDFIGVSLVDCDAKYISLIASVSGGISSSNFENAINTRIKEHSFSDEKLLRALEVYNSTFYLSRVNVSGRFILLMSAIECLIDQKKRNDEIINILDVAIKKIKKLHLDEIEINSVSGSLEFVKNESIKRSGKLLIKKLFMDSNNEYNNFAPEIFFSKAYDLRSTFVHDGKTSTRFLNITNNQLQKFTIDCLCRFYKYSRL